MKKTTNHCSEKETCNTTAKLSFIIYHILYTISRIYKELLHINKKKPKTKMGKRPEKTLLGDIQMANQHVTRN